MHLVDYANDEGESKSIEVKTEAFGQVKLDGIQIPEFDSVADFVASAPSEDDAVGFINRAVKNVKLAKARAAILAISANANLDLAKEKILESLKDSDVFTSAERATTINKAKAATLDKVQNAIAEALAGGGSLSMADLQALIAQS